MKIRTTGFSVTTGNMDRASWKMAGRWIRSWISTASIAAATRPFNLGFRYIAETTISVIESPIVSFDIKSKSNFTPSGVIHVSTWLDLQPVRWRGRNNKMKIQGVRDAARVAKSKQHTATLNLYRI